MTQSTQVMKSHFSAMDERFIINRVCSLCPKYFTKAKVDRYLIFTTLNTWKQMAILFYVSSVLMPGKSAGKTFIARLIVFNSEFVSTKIIHDLYQMCCEKRFRGNSVEEPAPRPRKTLYEYMVMPKEDPPPPRPPPSVQIEEPRTPTLEQQMRPNPLSPRAFPQSTMYDQSAPEIKRRTTTNNGNGNGNGNQGMRERSGTLPFVEHFEFPQPTPSVRSGNGHGNGTRTTTTVEISAPPRNGHNQSRISEIVDERQDH